ncbi:MAG: metal-dependent transcriptional regulator [Chloroflexi bacterium]|nr:metal-dependent transcriptional regulator [Chloroflexota bacterium]
MNDSPSSPAISSTMREYLGEVYRCHHRGERATTGLLASRLGVSLPAVAKMFARLDKAGYLRREPYQGVSLTSAGEREALRSIRRHRLLEVFLVKVMGFGWEETHDHSHALEGAVSDALEDRMDEMTGHPTRCPHGDPIPTKDGVMPVVDDVCLIDCAPGASGTLSRVRTHDPDKLRYLASLRLTPGAPIAVRNRAPFNGPVRVASAGAEHVLGAELASTLFVELNQGKTTGASGV